MSVEDQMGVANKVLSLLFPIDPYSIVAGGAPRDWYLGKEANDIDVFVYVRAGITNTMLECILRHQGLEIVPIEERRVAQDKECLYKSNPNIRGVYDCVVENQKVQIIILNKPTFNTVVSKFPLNICRVWYKHDKIFTTKEFEHAIKSKSIIKMDELYSDGDKYIKKIKNKFPDFRYYPSYKDFTIDGGTLV